MLHIMKEEVCKVLATAKNGTTTSPDEAENDILRILVNSLAPIMADLFDRFVKNCFIPKQWHQTEIILP